MGSEPRDQSSVECEAGEVYLLMKEEYRISRNIRASWFFGNLNKEIKVKSGEDLINSDEELDVISIIPKGSVDKIPPGTPIRYKLVPSSHVTFLARRYRHVIVMDLSPSMATVDIQSGRVCLLDLFTCICNCLNGLIKPFTVPGSSLLLSPKIYVTVIAYTPLASLTTQQVLFQGCLLTEHNLPSFLDQLQKELEEFENKLVENMLDTRFNTSSDSTFLGDHHIVFDDIIDKSERVALSSPHRHNSEGQGMATPEACFVNMLWCGILALQLLPENTSAGIICVTDGVTAMPDVACTNHLLTQMRNSTVACSFIQVGRGFHPHCSFGYIPHTEIMQFMATATFGAFLCKCPEIDISRRDMNQYHKAFLSWNFQKGLEGFKIDYVKGRQHQVVSPEVGAQSEGIQPPFALNKQGLCTIPLIRKKHRDYKLHTCLANVLSVRLREGYTIKDVALTKNDKQIEVKLALPWKYNGRIEYIASSAWPLNPNRHLTNVDVIMEGSYEFLLDVTCPMKKSPHNLYRAKVVTNFWQTLQSLQETDQLLVHLQSFSTNVIFYKVPEGIKKGIPLLYMPPYSDTPVLAQKFDTKDSSLEQFAAFWKRIALMEPKKWQRWLHTHKIPLLLVPDMPLPKHLYLPNNNGRYNNIQCRVAQKELNSLLTEFSTFTLLENHSYVTLTTKDANSPPTSFYLIRILSKAPCVVIRLAFLGGTPGHERNKIVNKLRKRLQELTVPMKQTSYLKAPTTQRKSVIAKMAQAVKGKPSQMEQKHTKDKPCIVILARPIDIVLVKYERMPPDFADLKTSIQVTTGSVPVYMDSKGPSKDLNRLACYLHHHRWIWDAQSDHSTPPISMEAVSHVLSVLTDLRLQEGFHFSYSNSGIISFVAELKMKNPIKSSCTDLFPGFQPHPSAKPDGGESTSKQSDPVQDGETDTVTDDSRDDVFPCLVQYIVFPPHTATYCRDRATGGSNHPDVDILDDQDTAEADGQLQLVTECWVEPQSGTVFDAPAERDYFQNCCYKDVPQVLFPLDQEVISTLLTFEHLKVMCHDPAILSPFMTQQSADAVGDTLRLSESITHLPFKLEVLKILPRCQQAEILCSMLIEEDLLESNATESQPRPQFPRYPSPNNTLYCLLLNALSKMSNHELTLSREESLNFTKMVLSRQRDFDNQPAPFNLSDSDYEALLKSAAQCEKEEAGRTTSLATDLSDSLSSTQPEAWHQAMREGQALRENPVPQWACYVKDTVRGGEPDKDAKPSAHLVLTFIPASYGDLQKLMDVGQVKGDDPNQVGNDTAKTARHSGNASPSTHEANQPSELNNSTEHTQSDANCEATDSDSNQDPGESDFKHGLTLPIYVYDCSLSSIKHQLLKHEDHLPLQDVFQDLTFASLEAQIEHFSSSRPSTPRGSLSRHSSKSHLEPMPGAPHNRCLSSGHPSKLLGRFCSQLGDKISKYFVMAIFKSLQRGQYVDCHDVQMALDYICTESLHDIDITHFLHAVCGHIRKYNEKVSLDQQASNLLVKKIKFADQVEFEVDEDEVDKDDQINRTYTKVKASPKLQKPSLSRLSKQSIKVPLSELMSSEPCPTGTSSLHEIIQDKFTQVMGYHFKPVPSNPDIWYYSLQDIDDIEVDVIFEEEAEDDKLDVEVTTAPEGEADKLRLRVMSEEIPSEQMSITSYTTGEEEMPIPENKINSIVDVYQSSLRRSQRDSDRGSDYEQSTSTESIMGSYEEEMTPLFVHLVCSVKLKDIVGNMTRRTIPTCLGHLIDCLESPPDEEIDPADLSVTLDLICLTLPSELDNDEEEIDDDYAARRREVSMTESSPPQSPDLHEDSPFTSTSNGEISGLDEMDNGCCEILGSLPEEQINAIHKTEDEIKWLLKDEMASAMHHIFPVTVETLYMVAQHVRDSFHDKPSCKATEIPLQFVFGPEQSLAKFTEDLKKLDIPGYELNKVGHYYHLMYDQTHVENVMRNHAIQSALENLGEQEPHRLMKDASASFTTKKGRFPSMTVICTPPSPCKAVRAQTDQGHKGHGELSKSSKVTEEGRTDEEVSGSSDSSIQVLSEEHDVETPSASTADLNAQPEQNNAVQIVLSSTHASPEGQSGVEQQFPPIKEEEDAEEGLRRNSTSFVVLSSTSNTLGDTQIPELDEADGDIQTVSEVFGGKEALSQSSASSTSTTITINKSDSGTLLDEEAEPPSDIPSMSQSTSTEPSENLKDELAPQEGSSTLTTSLERLSSHSSESDVAVQGKRFTLASSGPPSSQISYTGSLNDNDDEEGYEGGSSDLEPDDSQELINEQTRRRHLMPDFWLILRIHTDKVETFFHSRDPSESDGEIGEQLYQRVIEAIRSTCRIVNQRLLLQDLNKTRSCKSILLGESEEDIWQSDDPVRSRVNKPSLDDDGNDVDNAQKGYLFAAMTFEAGHFACDPVWYTHFPIHSRLYTGHRGSMASTGMQALVSALSAFAVLNRRNMFVFREKSEAVFYLRLFESTVVSHSSTVSRVSSTTDTGHQQEPGSQPMSRATSIQSLNTLTMGSVFEDEASVSHSPDPRRYSVADSGIDTMSTLSRATGPGRTEHTIKLEVHGVDPPGLEIREDLVELLTNRLAESTLDAITLMLNRNPMCKLTPSDVQFIQPPLKPPTETVHFKIPQSAMQHLYSLAFYLGQNLRQFLHTPKYSSNRSEDHFQDRTVAGTERDKGIELPDNEVYLYNRHQRAGRTGIGLACISMGLVDGRGNPVTILSCPRPSPMAHINHLDTGEFVALTHTERYYANLESPKKPGPTALIQFLIWQRGNVDLPHLTNRLMRAVQHSLCDVMMEYRILTAPMGVVSQDCIQGLTPFASPVKGVERNGNNPMDIVPSKGVRQLFRDSSEEKRDKDQSSPVSIKRSHSVSSSGANTIESSSRIRKQLSQEQKEDRGCSSGSQPSTPVKSKNKDPSPRRKDSSHMPGWQAQELERRQDEAMRERQREAEEGKIGVLHHFFQDVAHTWMDFEHSLDVSTVQKLTEELTSRFSLDAVINEFLMKLKTICSDLTTKVYKKEGDVYQLWSSADPKESKSQEKLQQDKTATTKNRPGRLLPGKSENYILIGRNIHQWRYSLDCPAPQDLVDGPSMVNPSTHKSYQRFKPLDVNSYGSSEKYSDRDVSPLTSLIGRSQGLHLVPRQRLFLMQIIDKKITLYVYNWSSELMDSLKTTLHRLVMWHNSRSHLLDCLVSQKMGLFNHTYFGTNKLKENPFCRSLEEIESLIKYTIPPKREFSSRMTVSAPKSARKLHRGLPPFDETLRNAKIRRTIQKSNYDVAKDPVVRSGTQALEVCIITKKETEILKKLENLYNTWQKRIAHITQPVSLDTLDLLKQSSRLVHYCATPLLFSPAWRHFVMSDMPETASSHSPTHSSGGMVAEEAWHVDLRSSFLQQYVQFLQKLGLTPIETKVSSPRQTIKAVRLKDGARSHSPVHRKSLGISASQYLQISVAGGIILIELSYQHAYFCVRIYAFESSRVPGVDINQQLAMLFTDNCDRYKDLIHLHSFAHDFHLRTIQSYFHRPEMGFKSHYHVTRFLADFVKFFTPRPKFCRNHIHQEHQGFLSHNTPAPLLYQYLMDHPPPSMKKLSMSNGSINPQDVSENEEEEYAVVNLIPRSAVYKDNKGKWCHDELDRSVVICRSENQSQTRPNSPTPTTPEPSTTNIPQDQSLVVDTNPNLLNLCFYVIVTSKRDLYPIQHGWKSKTPLVNFPHTGGIPPSENTRSYILLKEEVQHAKDRIVTTVRQAANNCRRDTLWDQLRQGELLEEGGASSSAASKRTRRKEGDELKDPSILRMTYPEFKVLLDTVHQVPLSHMDERLVPLLSNGIPWYEGLLRFLRSKFSHMTRFFTSEDNLVTHLALINPNHPDMMVLLTVDKQANMSELVAIFREEPQGSSSDSESKGQQVLATQRQMEIVIDAVTYYMWTTII
ncbi:KICSTOR complex protein SZT2-like isoform X4 [Asterias amurensis]|uniref:KICSTOR complex protein SZT2-like isoform X4 n=1 Tax=Asterias amurensis TaxID=7602 RepID=UPI003AB89E71